MKKAAIALSLALTTTAALAEDELTVYMMDPSSGEAAGEVMISESEYGLVFTPSLEGLSPGGHGFHVHETPSCESAEKNGKTVPAGAAGSHLDPEKTGQHGYSWSDNSHLGDLPILLVDSDGMATHPVLAPRLSMDDLKDRALMIHEGGDNYSDAPEKLGGGGARALCGVIKS